MAAKIYDKIPIVDTARRCGLVLDSRTLRRKEVEASCPFCGDHGPGKYHLSLNTDTDQYRCNLCGAHGNSVSLYARIKGICNKEAYLELAHESKVYPLPQPPSPQTQERQPCSLEQRHAVYSDMLAHLTLLPKHGENLLERGLSEERIRRNEYFSLANLLVDKDELSSLCESMGIPYTGSTRLSLGDAFRSATGDIRERVPVTVDGETNIYLAYCRDNKRTAGVFSRELVKETLNRETNRYEKLANISCGKNDGMFRCDNLVLDDAVDVQGCCRKAEELFELYQRCANRKQIETICVNFLRGMEATKLSVTGHMYFVPRTFMERVDIFEDFITLLSGLNKKQTPLVVNSFYIIDDAKQRDKMTEEFYLAVKKEIAAYQEKCDYLIKSSSQSPAVMERWVLKVQALEEKKRHYEGVLQRELDGLDDEFSVLKLLSQELQVRANSIRSQRFQQKAA